MTAASARDLGLELDLTRARASLVAGLGEGANPFTLSSGVRLDLIEESDRERIGDMLTEKRSLFEWGYPDRPLTSLDQHDWSIRLLALFGEMSEDQRDGLAERLRASWTREVELKPAHDILPSLLRITELCEVIGRQPDVSAHREEVHDWLRCCFSTEEVGFTPAGGFKMYPTQGGPSLEGTWYAIRLMRIYGVPEGIDFNWLKSFLSPWNFRHERQAPLLHVCRAELSVLQGIPRTTWTNLLAAERNLWAALVLVLLCVYASLSAPRERLVEAPEK
ncbi:MAG: hypothetical protein V2A76_16020 [Planctomycetota bacterium]